MNDDEGIESRKFLFFLFSFFFFCARRRSFCFQGILAVSGPLFSFFDLFLFCNFDSLLPLSEDTASFILRYSIGRFSPSGQTREFPMLGFFRTLAFCILFIAFPLPCHAKKERSNLTFILPSIIVQNWGLSYLSECETEDSKRHVHFSSLGVPPRVGPVVRLVVSFFFR